ncbi:MAG TPA: M14 family metallopeptidase [Gemmatimonadaceae bacterium]|nr:M14 family metallopeptidase [Gemmatimonadaceae bacterium]
MLAALVLSGVSGCAVSSRTSAAESGVSVGIYSPSSVARVPATRAERTNYLETSHYADVVVFLDSLKRLGAPYAFGSIGRTFEGRDIPYVVASRPLVHTPAEAQATGKPIVYVQGNIHAGEVEGKEALLAMLRDLAFARGPGVLDSIVLIAVPIYNADGNERFGPQEKQRSEQNGPELVGQRPNAQGLDLNRDYIKAEAPETRASLRMFALWNPDVFVDLHTTDGSFHGYALTYSPSLNPAAPLGAYTRELLAELRKRVRDREHYETFDYGNFADAFGREVSTDTVPKGWYTYDHRPRFGTNYYGLRNRVAILSEAFSHDSFERRVKSTYAFTRQLLSLVAERGTELTEHTRVITLSLDEIPKIPLRAALPPTAPQQPVTFEVLARTGDSSRTEAGVPKGLRRTGEFRTRSMPVFDRFVSTLDVLEPLAYLVRATDTSIVARLRQHGLTARRFTPVSGPTDEFVVDSIVRAPRVFQGHNEVRVVGHWRRAAQPPRGEWLTVPAVAPLTPLVMYLLDPESDDSFATWNLLDAGLQVGQVYPVLRVSTLDGR